MVTLCKATTTIIDKSMEEETEHQIILAQHVFFIPVVNVLSFERGFINNMIEDLTDQADLNVLLSCEECC